MVPYFHFYHSRFSIQLRKEASAFLCETYSTKLNLKSTLTIILSNEWTALPVNTNIFKLTYLSLKNIFANCILTSCLWLEAELVSKIAHCSKYWLLLFNYVQTNVHLMFLLHRFPGQTWPRFPAEKEDLRTFLFFKHKTGQLTRSFCSMLHTKYSYFLTLICTYIDTALFWDYS